MLRGCRPCSEPAGKLQGRVLYEKHEKSLAGWRLLVQLHAPSSSMGAASFNGTIDVGHAWHLCMESCVTSCTRGQCRCSGLQDESQGWTNEGRDSSFSSTHPMAVHRMKTLLAVVATLNPFPGYDTTTSLLFLADAERHASLLNRNVLQKLVRWDAVYFSTISMRNYLHEQEWAFGWGYTRFTAFLAGLGTASPSFERHAWTGVLVTNASHLLSAFILHRLTLHLVAKHSHRRRIALIAACLHVIAPGGLFLAAPNAEALFSLLNFTGMLFYVKARSV
ncbi:hypothetical protein MRB53_037323 [Persea americana]|nr:hypothetical protein MRB53_037323 [Persea americana]